jgi:hypothetical protein
VRAATEASFAAPSSRCSAERRVGVVRARRRGRKRSERLRAEDVEVANVAQHVAEPAQRVLEGLQRLAVDDASQQRHRRTRPPHAHAHLVHRLDLGAPPKRVGIHFDLLHAIAQDRCHRRRGGDVLRVIERLRGRPAIELRGEQRVAACGLASGLHADRNVVGERQRELEEARNIAGRKLDLDLGDRRFRSRCRAMLSRMDAADVDAYRGGGAVVEANRHRRPVESRDEDRTERRVSRRLVDGVPERRAGELLVVEWRALARAAEPPLAFHAPRESRRDFGRCAPLGSLQPVLSAMTQPNGHARSCEAKVGSVEVDVAQPRRARPALLEVRDCRMPRQLAGFPRGYAQLELGLVRGAHAIDAKGRGGNVAPFASRGESGDFHRGGPSEIAGKGTKQRAPCLAACLRERVCIKAAKTRPAPSRACASRARCA